MSVSFAPWSVCADIISRSASPLARRKVPSHFGMNRVCPFESGPISRKANVFSVSRILKLGISPLVAVSPQSSQSPHVALTTFGLTVLNDLAADDISKEKC